MRNPVLLWGSKRFCLGAAFSVQKWLLTTCQLKKQLRQQNGSMESAWQALWAATQDSGLIKTNHAQQNTLITIDSMIAVFLPRFSWYQSLWLSNLLQASAAQGQMASSSMGPAMLDTWKTMISPGFQKTPQAQGLDQWALWWDQWWVLWWDQWWVLCLCMGCRAWIRKP